MKKDLSSLWEECNESQCDHKEEKPRAEKTNDANVEKVDEACSTKECSIDQNNTASEVFVQGLAGIVNQQNVEAMIGTQKEMLQRYDKTNEMLKNCNSLSANRLERALNDFSKHSQHINGLKKELDNIFKRIRSIKSKIAQQYPEAYKGTGVQMGPVQEEDDEYDIQIRQKKIAEVKDD